MGEKGRNDQQGTAYFKRGGPIMGVRRLGFQTSSRKRGGSDADVTKGRGKISRSTSGGGKSQGGGKEASYRPKIRPLSSAVDLENLGGSEFAVHIPCEESYRVRVCLGKTFKRWGEVCREESGRLSPRIIRGMQRESLRMIEAHPIGKGHMWKRTSLVCYGCSEFKKTH